MGSQGPCCHPPLDTRCRCGPSAAGPRPALCFLHHQLQHQGPGCAAWSPALILAGRNTRKVSTRCFQCLHVGRLCLPSKTVSDLSIKWEEDWGWWEGRGRVISQTKEDLQMQDSQKCPLKTVYQGGSGILIETVECVHPAKKLGPGGLFKALFLGPNSNSSRHLLKVPVFFPQGRNPCVDTGRSGVGTDWLLLIPYEPLLVGAQGGLFPFQAPGVCTEFLLSATSLWCPGPHFSVISLAKPFFPPLLSKHFKSCVASGVPPLYLIQANRLT